MEDTDNKDNALPLEDALALFDQLADLAHVAFGYPHNGCSARAHIMCRIMTDAGLAPAKAWAFESDAKMLEITLSGDAVIRWSYHVAPALPVRMPDDSVEHLIFDPGLFDGPVSLREWGKVMQAEEKSLQIAKTHQTPKPWPGFYDRYTQWPESADRNAQHMMEEYLYMQRLPRCVFPSQTRRQFAEAPQQGKTWRVIAEHPPLASCPAHAPRKATP